MIATTIGRRAARHSQVAIRWNAVPIGLGGGLALGIAARAWMRLIATDPEFTWSGTIFIVGAFGVFGTGQGLAWQARRVFSRRWAVRALRIVGTVTTLPLFVGAGAIMLPTVLGGSLARWRQTWPPSVRVLVGVPALVPVIAVVASIGANFGWGPHGLAGIAGFVAIYAVVITSLGPTVEPFGGRAITGLQQPTPTTRSHHATHPSRHPGIRRRPRRRRRLHDVRQHRRSDTGSRR